MRPVQAVRPRKFVNVPFVNVPFVNVPFVNVPFVVLDVLCSALKF